MAEDKIPSSVLSDMPAAAAEAEEPKASFGERASAYLAAQKKSTRGAPVLQDWYKKALDKRRAQAPSEREMGFAPVMTALNATEGKKENTRTNSNFRI